MGKIKKLDLYLKSLTRKYFPWIRDLDVKMKPNMYQKKTVKFLYNLVYDLKSRSNQRKVINLTRKHKELFVATPPPHTHTYNTL